MSATATHPDPKKPRISFDELLNVNIAHGSHGGRYNGLCALEAASWLAGEKHSDRPECVCPVIASFLRSWNDGLPSDDDRNRLLKPLIPKILNTRGTRAQEDRRVWMLTDWLIREFTPAFLRLAKIEEEADAIIALPEIVDIDTLGAAIKVLEPARAKARAAWDAASAAARAAARAAALAAASAAAGDAAREAARAAAVASAAAAALAAAGSTLQPTVSKLQDSAVALVERMTTA